MGPTKVNKKSSIGLFLIRWQDHNATEVELLQGSLFLGEVAHQVEAFARVVHSGHVEEKGLHIVVEGFMIQKQLSQDTQLLAVEFGHLTVNFEDRDILTSVDLISRWIESCALALQ